MTEPACTHDFIVRIFIYRSNVYRVETLQLINEYFMFLYKYCGSSDHFRNRQMRRLRENPVAR